MGNGFSVIETEIGILRIDYVDDLLLGVQKIAVCPDDVGNVSRISIKTERELAQYFSGQRTHFDIPFKLIGTEFQKRVWNELCRIPYGKTRSYKQVAEAIGCQGGSRAVGMANNRNPLLIIVPCHRVIGSDGKLVGFGCGIATKSFLLDLEKKSCE